MKKHSKFFLGSIISIFSLLFVGFVLADEGFEAPFDILNQALDGNDNPITNVDYIDIDTAGVRLDSDDDGSLVATGQGDGFDESITYNLDDVENTMGVSSTTGVDTIDYGAINLTTTGTVSTGDIAIGGLSTGDISVANATPAYNFIDTDGDGSIDGAISGNLTDTGVDSEDFDMTFAQMINGVLTTWLNVDADGVINLGGGLVQFNRALGYLTMGSGKSIAILDDGNFTVGTGQDVFYRWDTNGVGDDLWLRQLRKLSANDTACVFNTRDLDPDGMTITDDCIGYTEIDTFDEGADANDFVGVLRGFYQQSDVTAKNYYNLVSFVGSADGSLDVTTTELASVFRIGDTATSSDYADSNDLFVTQDFEVAGQVVFTGIAQDVGATCTAGQAAFDTGGATREWCYCYAADTWSCISETTGAGPTD